MPTSRDLPAQLENSIMIAPPTNTIGVICLFSEWARERRIKLESIQPGSPNCTARVRAGDASRRILIDFKVRSRSYRGAAASSKGERWLVCWEHDWPECPKRIKVIELRKEHGLGFNVWAQPVSDDAPAHFSSQLSKVKKRCTWSVASQAQEGDLVLFYHSTPRREIGDVFRVDGPVEVQKARGGTFVWNARRRDYFADLVRVAKLKSPVTLEHLKSHPALMDAGWIRNNLISRAKATVDWMFIRELIVERNPSLRGRLPDVDGLIRKRSR
jgi:predicted RNA-binding protein with PUA-like domain